MDLSLPLLRTILVAEALLFVPGLPAWSRLAGASAATQSYLLCLGVFACIAALTLMAGKPSSRIWIWAVAATNLPVAPVLTPVGGLVALLVLTLERATDRRTAGPSHSGAWWAWLTCLAFCWAATWNVHRFAQVSGLPGTPALILFGGLWVMAAVCLGAHQAGHWLAGRDSDLTPTAAWSGWADPQPAAFSGDRLSQRLFLWTMSGPLASLALGALCLAVFVTSPGTPWAGIGELAGLSASCSLAIFLLSILPWRAAGYRSDGATLLMIARHGAEYRRDRALMLLAGDWLRGSSPRNWNPEWLRTAASFPDLSRQHATACGLNYFHCLDHGFGSSARFWIGRLANEFAEDRHAVPVRWQLELSHYLAAYDRSSRVIQAPAWRRAAGRGQGAPYAVLLRTEAALAFARGRPGKAAELVQAAEHIALGQGRGGCWELEMNLLARLRDRIEPSHFTQPAHPQAEVSYGAV